MGDLDESRVTMVIKGPSQPKVPTGVTALSYSPIDHLY